VSGRVPVTVEVAPGHRLEHMAVMLVEPRPLVVRNPVVSIVATEPELDPQVRWVSCVRSWLLPSL